MGKLIAAVGGAIFGGVFALMTVRHLANDALDKAVKKLSEDDDAVDDADAVEGGDGGIEGSVGEALST